MTKKYLDGNGLGTFWENAKEYIDSKSGSSEVVNGIIEQYKASTTTIDANTFVEFVNGAMEVETDAMLSDAPAFTGEGTDSDSIAATDLGSNKVFVAYNGNGYLCGMVCTISGTTITTGTATQLSTGLSSYDHLSAVLVGTNKVFIAHRNGGYLYGIVCTISGTTITKGTDTQLSTGQSSSSPTSAISIDTDKVFLTYNGDNTAKYLYGMVCTVSGTTITANTGAKICGSLSGTTSYKTSMAAIGNNKVFVSFCYSPTSGYTLYGVICTISGGTAVSAGPCYALVDSGGGGYKNYTMAINDGAVLVLYNAVGTGRLGKLYGMVCTISSTSITRGTETQLTDITNSGAGLIRAVQTDNNDFFVMHTDYSSGYIYTTTCTISGTTITAGTDTATTIQTLNYTTDAEIIQLNNPSTFFIAHSAISSDKLYGAILAPNQSVKASTTKIEGLTKTECTTTTAGEVWVLDN